MENKRFQDYCYNRMMHLNTPAILRDGKWYRAIHDCWLITEREFKRRFPLVVRSKERAKENPCKKSKWLIN